MLVSIPKQQWGFDFVFHSSSVSAGFALTLRLDLFRWYVFKTTIHRFKFKFQGFRARTDNTKSPIILTAGDITLCVRLPHKLKENSKFIIAYYPPVV